MSAVLAAEIVVLAFMVAGAAFAARARDLLSATLFLALVSAMLSVEMFLLNAPDVAITEAGAGVVLATAMFVFAIGATERMEGGK